MKRKIDIPVDEVMTWTNIGHDQNMACNLYDEAAYRLKQKIKGDGYIWDAIGYEIVRIKGVPHFRVTIDFYKE